MSKSLNYRKDYRTIKQFKKDIFQETSKERFLMNLFLKEMKYKKIPVECIDFGVDNSGKFVTKSNSNADYKIIYNEQTYLVEIKNSPVANKCTFKISDLKSYVKNKVYILLFVNTGYIKDNHSDINYKNTRWTLIRPNNIEQMLKDKEPYKEYLFGNKLCLKITNDEYSKYFKLKKLTHIK